MSQHNRQIVHLADMVDRYERALAAMEQIVGEAEGRPDWRFLQSRVKDLERRITALTEDAQVGLFNRQGLYNQRKAGAA